MLYISTVVDPGFANEGARSSTEGASIEYQACWKVEAFYEQPTSIMHNIRNTGEKMSGRQRGAWPPAPGWIRHCISMGVGNHSSRWRRISVRQLFLRYLVGWGTNVIKYIYTATYNTIKFTNVSLASKHQVTVWLSTRKALLLICIIMQLYHTCSNELKIHLFSNDSNLIH